jgi:hypothetical protein
MPDFDAINTALVARFSAAQVTPPAGGYDNVRVATGDLPGQMTPLPTVLVFPESGTFTHSAGKRDSVHTFTVRFYYNQSGDAERDFVPLRKWLTILVNQLQTGAQLGGIVTQAKVLGWKVGVMTYASIPYTGIELSVMVNVNEAWSPVS